MNPIVFVAFTNVRPIKHVDSTVWARLQFHSTKPLILRLEHIRFVLAGVTIPIANQPFDVHPTTMKIQREGFVTKPVRPIIALINHEA